MRVPSQDRRQITYAKILYCIVNILGNVSRANFLVLFTFSPLTALALLYVIERKTIMRGFPSCCTKFSRFSPSKHRGGKTDIQYLYSLMIVKYLCPNAMAGKMSGGCDPIDRGPAGAAQEDGQWKLVRVVGGKSAVKNDFRAFTSQRFYLTLKRGGRYQLKCLFRHMLDEPREGEGQ